MRTVSNPNALSPIPTHPFPNPHYQFPKTPSQPPQRFLHLQTLLWPRDLPPIFPNALLSLRTRPPSSGAISDPTPHSRQFRPNIAAPAHTHQTSAISEFSGFQNQSRPTGAHFSLFSNAYFEYSSADCVYGD
jgi:hypothetical protein